MVDINDVWAGEYLRRDDVKKPMLVTIKDVQEHVFRREGKNVPKLLISFEEDARVFVSNVTNSRIIAAFVGSSETNDWVGAKIVIYDDPTVTMRGSVVGGLRVRPPRGQATQRVEAAAKRHFDAEPVDGPVEEYRAGEVADDDVPF